MAQHNNPGRTASDSHDNNFSFNGSTNEEDLMNYSDSANVQCDSGVGVRCDSGVGVQCDSGVCLTFKSCPCLSSDSVRPAEAAAAPTNEAERLAENIAGINLQSGDSRADDQSDWAIKSLVQEAPITAPENSDIFEQNDDGDTYLHLAILNRDNRYAMFLIRAAAAERPEYFALCNDGYLLTPLHIAVLTDQPSIARELIIHGASPAVRDRCGDTPLHFACAQALISCLVALTSPLSAEERAEKCATVVGCSAWAGAMRQLDMAATNYEGQSCLHLAQASKSAMRVLVLNYLLDFCEADVNVKETKCGYTVLHQAVIANDRDVVKLLLRHSTLDVNARCYGGASALTLARSLRFDDVTRMLVERGAMNPIVYERVEEETSEEESDNEMEQDFNDLTIAGRAHSLP